MRVEASVVNHPKFLRLKRAVGDAAMECLVRIWGHCEAGQKGEVWKGADRDYVEAVAQWAGEPGQLYNALLASRWIEETRRGVKIHDWEAFNSFLVHNWKNGKYGHLGGRPKTKPTETPRPTPSPELATPVKPHGAPTGHPERERERESDKNDLKTNKNGADAAKIAASKAKFAALTARIQLLRSLGEAATDAQRRELLEKEAQLEQLQKDQSEGRF